MSWQDMVNTNLLGSGHVSKAAICGLDGSVWAKSDNFKISDSEAAAAAKGFQAIDTLQGSGLRFESTKFFVLQADQDRVMGKKGADGFFIDKTKQAVVIAIYEGGIQPEMCSKTAGALADYLRSTGY